VAEFACDDIAAQVDYVTAMRPEDWNDPEARRNAVLGLDYDIHAEGLTGTDVVVEAPEPGWKRVRPGDTVTVGTFRLE
jgi:hypothetical protein